MSRYPGLSALHSDCARSHPTEENLYPPVLYPKESNRSAAAFLTQDQGFGAVPPCAAGIFYTVRCVATHGPTWSGSSSVNQRATRTSVEEWATMEPMMTRAARCASSTRFGAPEVRINSV